MTAGAGKGGARAPSYWYADAPVPVLAQWLSALYAGVTSLRRRLYRKGWLRRRHPGVPVLVVGNITAGGAGKTPLTIALVQRLQAWCAARSVKLKSMQPAWLRAYAGLRGDAATGGFAQLRHGWLCMGLWSGGRWLHMRGEALDDAAALPAVLERRLSLFDGALDGGQLFVQGAPSMNLPRGWRCVAGGVVA